MANMETPLERYSRVTPILNHLQQMKPKTEGVTVTLSSITRTVQTPDGGTQKATYRQGDPESAFDGILHIWYGDWSYTGRVPVRRDATRFPVSVNMYDTIAGSGADIPDAIVSALKNFDFFTVVQSGNYFPGHPGR